MQASALQLSTSRGRRANLSNADPQVQASALQLSTLRTGPAFPIAKLIYPLAVIAARLDTVSCPPGIYGERRGIAGLGLPGCSMLQYRSLLYGLDLFRHPIETAADVMQAPRFDARSLEAAGDQPSA